jgi:hypothetical protein
MQAEAIAKINAEVKSSKNPYVHVVGQFLLSHLDTNPEDARLVFNADKTIMKSLGEMRKVAEGRKIDNCAVLTDQEGFDIVLKYFGVGVPDEVQVPPAEEPVSTPSLAELDDELAAMLL